MGLRAPFFISTQGFVPCRAINLRALLYDLFPFEIFRVPFKDYPMSFNDLNKKTETTPADATAKPATAPATGTAPTAAPTDAKATPADGAEKEAANDAAKTGEEKAAV